jgi:hypothetical protein
MVKRSPSEIRRACALLAKIFGCFFLIALIGLCIALYRDNDLVANSTHVDGTVIALNADAKGRLGDMDVRLKCLD